MPGDRKFVNRVVDITKYIDKKVEANLANINQGPGGGIGARLKKNLADKGMKLSLFGDDDYTANFNYIKEFELDMDSEKLRGVPSDKKIGEKYGLG